MHPPVLRSPAVLLALLLWSLGGTAPPATGQAPADSVAGALPGATPDATPDTALDAMLDAVLDAVLDAMDPEEEDLEPLADRLRELLAAPLDLNAASAEALARLPFLSPSLARRIVAHRRRHGPFRSVDGLRAVQGMAAERYEVLRPFVTVAVPVGGAARRSSGAAGLRVQVLQRLARRLPPGRGYTSDSTKAHYLGGPHRLLTRLTVRLGANAANVTLEKDPGEPFAWDPASRTFGYDFASAYVSVGGRGPLERLVVGDFVVSRGQGLVFWRGQAAARGREPVDAVRSGDGLAPSGSAQEYGTLRGVGVALRLAPSLTATLVASRRRHDATTAPDSGAALVVRSLAEDGLHRTTDERRRKGGVREQLLGADLSFARGRLRAGLSGYVSRYDRPVAPPPEPYRRHAFSGTRRAVAGASIDVFAGRYHFFGEAAVAPRGVVGAVGGVAAELPGGTEVLVLGRSYPPSFDSPFGRPFAAYSGPPRNEQGWYAGVKTQPARGWTVAAAFDQYRAPWLRFQVPRPGAGHEALLAVEHRPRRWLHVYALARTERRDAGTTAPDAQGRLLSSVSPSTRRSLRLHGDYTFSPRLRLQVRLERVRAATPAGGGTGTLLYQGVRWLPVGALQVDARLAFFDTGHFAARLHAYEDDLRHAFAVPVLHGRGQRAYVLARVSAGRHVTVQGKYGVTRFEDVRSVGSGLDEAPGKVLREVALQVVAQF